MSLREVHDDGVSCISSQQHTLHSSSGWRTILEKQLSTPSKSIWNSRNPLKIHRNLTILFFLDSRESDRKLLFGLDGNASSLEMLQAFECGKGEVMCWMKCRPAVSEPNCHDVKCWSKFKSKSKILIKIQLQIQFFSKIEIVFSRNFNKMN